ncbi:unnamed protein product [Ceratitis capitata]|uniref:(Mediterranean fruit fly) hypothetical protein n=1 Tax=Ceratitis capitata TaxID=7213 RepID=A0A811UJN0_CERCA|nr:unnamed protein product [Ceratitis capitata]
MKTSRKRRNTNGRTYDKSAYSSLDNVVIPLVVSRKVDGAENGNESNKRSSLGKKGHLGNENNMRTTTTTTTTTKGYCTSARRRATYCRIIRQDVMANGAPFGVPNTISTHSRTLRHSHHVCDTLITALLSLKSGNAAAAPSAKVNLSPPPRLHLDFTTATLRKGRQLDSVQRVNNYAVIDPLQLTSHPNSLATPESVPFAVRSETLFESLDQSAPTTTPLISNENGVSRGNGMRARHDADAAACLLTRHRCAG